MTLHLTLYYDTATVWSDTACEMFTWNDSVYTQSGDYTQQFSSIHGCDSTVTLHLTVNHATDSILAVTTCDSFLWHGITYFESTFTPTFDTVNAVGCDSTVILHLTINHSSDSILAVTACDSFLWHGTTYFESTFTPTFDTVNAMGCDSTVTLHLTVNHSSDSILAVTACDSFLWHGTTYFESTFTPTFDTVNAVGCDSIVTLHLTINHSSDSILIVTACDSFLWHGITYYESTFTPTFDTVNAIGCDSTVNLHLTIRFSTDTTFTATVVENELPYHINDTISFMDEGDYTVVIPNAAGCDSTINLTLVVSNNVTASAYDTICETELPFTWNNVTFHTTGDSSATVTLTAVSGADSVLTMHLHVDTVVRVNADASVCFGDTYDSLGFLAVITADTLLTDTVPSLLTGCDSITTVSVTMLSPTASTVTIDTCDSFTWINGVIYTSSTDTPTVVLSNAVGCDSTVTLHLTIRHSSDSIETITACDSAVWHGKVFYESTDTATFHTLNAVGCDSLVTLHLTVNHSSDSIETIIACDSAVWHGITYYESTNTVTFDTINAAGCDSTVILHLTINHSKDSIETVIACDSAVWNGMVFHESTDTATYHTFTTAGCDSVVTLNLTVKNKTYGTDTQEACDSYTWIDSVTYTESNNTATYTIAGGNAQGCDSVVTLHLTVNHSTTGDTTAVACDRFTWHGTEYTTSGDYEKHYTNAAGCDSTVTLHLTVNKSYQVSESRVVCSSGMPYTWNEVVFNEPDTKVATLHSIHGCDSVVTMTLTVSDAYSVTQEVVVCSNELPYRWIDGVDYNESTSTPTKTLTATNGCDSVVTLHLTVNQMTTGETEVTACDSYTWDGTEYTTSGDYEKHYTNAAGCDSVVTLHLTIGHSNTGDTTAFACNSFDWYEHTNITSSTETLTHTFTNASGCDSVVTLHLTVGHSNTGDTTAVACDSFDWYEHTNITSSTEALTHTFTNASGCDSVVTLHLTINPLPETPVLSVTNNTSCDKPNGMVVVASPTGSEYTYSLNGGDFQNGVLFNGLGVGAYIVTVKDANGCVTSATGSVSTIQSTLSVSASAESPCLGGDIQLTATPSTEAVTYAWTGPNGFASTFQNPIRGISSETMDGTYTVVVTEMATGCTAAASAEVTVKLPVTYQFSHTSCDSYTWNGIDYSVSGDYTQTFTAENGCDSVVTLKLLIAEPHHQTYTEHFCGESYEWNGVMYSEDGDYTYSHYDENGCLQVDTLHLTIGTPSLTELYLINCGSYEWEGVLYESSGYYTRVFTNQVGCDSVVNLVLRITNSTEIFLYDTVLASEYPFVWFGDTIYHAGFYKHDVITESGCDSSYNIVFVTKCDYKIDFATEVSPALCGNDDATIEVTDIWTSIGELFPPYYYGINIQGQVVWKDSSDVKGYLYDSLSSPDMHVIIVRDGMGCFVAKQTFIPPRAPATLTCPPQITDTLEYGELYITADPDTLGMPVLINWDSERLLITNDIPEDYRFYEGDNVIHWEIVDTVCDNDVRWQCDQHVVVTFPSCPSAVDCEGNVYPGVRIGSYCWTQRNLESLVYGNGCTDSIPCVYEYTNTQYPDAAANVALFGRLYCYEAAVRDSAVNEYGHIQGICPDGWYLPTPEQYESLYSNGGYALKTPDYWLTEPGGNSTGFSWLPAGFYNGAKDRFEGLLTEGYFWSAAVEHGQVSIISVIANYYCDSFASSEAREGLGYSVRCIKERE